MEENKKDLIDEVEQEYKYKIITLEDEKQDSAAKKYLDALSDEIEKRSEEFKKWVDENKDNEKFNEMKDKFMAEMDALIEKSKEVLEDIKNNEELREKIETGKVVFAKVSDKVFTTVDAGVQEILHNESVAKTIDKVSDKVVEFVKDERVQQGAKKVRKGVLNVAESAYSGLKKVLKADELKDEEKE